MRTCSLFALAFLSVSVLVSGCGSSGFSKRGNEKKSTGFTYAMATAPTTLDPALVQDIETTDVLQNIHEGLVGYDESNALVGKLAEKWDISKDGKTYTFHLRENAKFQNGRKVSAEDVKWTLERNLNKDFNSPTAINYLSDIIGADAFHKGEAKEVSGIVAKDPATVEINIDKARPYFLGKLTYPCAFILPKESAGTAQIGTTAAAIGAGPFQLTGYKPDQELTLTAFKEYHEGAPKIDQINRPIILDPATRLSKFKAGEVDILTIQRQEITAAKSDPELASLLVFQPRPSVFYIGLSQLAYPPFKDPKVRLALAYSIDRKRITTELLGGVPEAKGLVPDGVQGFASTTKGIEFNPEKAKQLLAEAGHPGGKDLLPLNIVYRVQTPDSQVIAEAVATSVRQATGWSIKPTGSEWSAMLSARNKRQLSAYVLSWYGDYLDPQNFLSFLFRSDSPQNRDGYANAEFDRLTDQADTTLDEKVRMKLYAEAEKIAVEEGARLPIHFGRDAILISKRVKGLRANLFGNLPHTTVSVE